MKFTTLGFFLFFAIVYLLYWNVKGRRAKIGLLLISSILFYAAWSPAFTLHFLGIVIINFYLMRQLSVKKSKLLFFSILTLNVANLFLFKYFYLFLRMLHDLAEAANLFLQQSFDISFKFHNVFLQDNFNAKLLDSFGIGEIILPLAISFYTFQLVAYAVDVYQDKIKETDDLLTYTAFIMFFPQLVAGPIMRRTDFIPQLDSIRPSEEKMIDGMLLLMLGFTKKILVADNTAPVIIPIFTHPEHYDWLSNFMAAAGYSVRVYCDFSGYTDIARGLGKMLGLDLPENFKGPYLSSSMREIWNRWHITLSTWIRDYLYYPLGGSRRGETRNFITLVFSFFLAGLWHGAAYTLIIWGVANGLLLALERLLRLSFEARFGKNALKQFTDRIPQSYRFILRIPAVALVSFIWIISVIIFNAPSLSSGFIMIERIFTGATGLRGPDNVFLGWMLLIVYVFNWIQRIEKRPAFFSGPYRYAFVLCSAFVLAILLGRYSPQGVDFIYFQF